MRENNDDVVLHFLFFPSQLVLALIWPAKLLTSTACE